jgi:hypothetical protein
MDSVTTLALQVGAEPLTNDKEERSVEAPAE